MIECITELYGAELNRHDYSNVSLYTGKNKNSSAENECYNVENEKHDIITVSATLIIVNSAWRWKSNQKNVGLI